MRLIPVLLPLLALPALPALDNVRFDLSAVKEAITLADPEVVEGKGTAQPASWLKDNAPYSISASFAIPARTWTRVGVRFTPDKDGRMNIALMGPYKRQAVQPPDAKSPALQTLLVRWDEVSAEGATIVNGGMETPSRKQAELPQGWWTEATANGPQVIGDPGVAQAGAKAVQTWHNGRLNQAVEVKAGVPVTLTAWAWSEYEVGSL